ncbi:MAG: HlyC/CorC family transporter [Rickettsiaceae bacterium]|nr:HlyC/CorC family transporter [Rickettsiaceae bacterium]
MLVFSILLVIVLLGISAYFSAIETAITGASPGRIQKLKSEGNLRAIAVLKIFKIKDQAISTLLIANSFINTVSTTIATTILISIFGEEKGTIIASTVMALMIIVFAEVIPKAIALVKADRIALNTVGIINGCLMALRPVNYALNIIIKIFFAVFRIKSEAELSGADEVRGVIEHHMAEGKVVKSDRDMLGGVLDMGDLSVSEIMVHRSSMFTIDSSLAIDKIAAKALTCPHTRIPVWKDSKDNIVGVLHLKNMLLSLYKANFDYNKITLSDFVSEPWFIPENAPVIQQLQEFRKRRSHFALVVDEYGDLQGLVTLEDILEEIVGQIDDEYDHGPSNIIKKGENKFLIEGSTSIRDVNRELNWNLPDDNASTLGGLIMHELHKLPKQGEVFELFDLKITIYSRLATRIKTLMVEPIEKPEQDLDI